MHLLAFASRYHVFQHSELLVHLGSPPPFDQAVRCLSRNLASGCGCTRIILLPFASYLGRPSSVSTSLLGCTTRLCLQLVALLRLHLDDLPRPGWWRRQSEVILGNDGPRPPRPSIGRWPLAGGFCWGRGRDRSIGRIGSIRRGSCGRSACSIRLVEGSRGKIEGRRCMRTFLASDVATGARRGRRVWPRHYGRMKLPTGRPTLSLGVALRSSSSSLRLSGRPSGMEDMLGVGIHGGRCVGGYGLRADKGNACAEEAATVYAAISMVKKSRQSARRRHVSSVACHHSRKHREGCSATQRPITACAACTRVWRTCSWLRLTSLCSLLTTPTFFSRRIIQPWNCIE